MKSGLGIPRYLSKASYSVASPPTAAVARYAGALPPGPQSSYRPVEREKKRPQSYGTFLRGIERQLVLMV